MLADWKISSEVDGKTFVVTVERAPNGKDTIRVNGHVAAKPISPDEAGRAISVAGQSYLVNRTGPDTFTLDRDELADAQDRSHETARVILANAPAPLMPTGIPLSRMMPMIGWAVVFVAVAGLLFWMLPKSYDKLAADRVGLILIEMKEGKNPDLSRAIRLWGKAPYSMDSQELSSASDGFDKWRQKKGLYNEPFTNFAVTSSKVVEGTKVPTAIVTFTIEKTEYKVRVTRGIPIAWED
ncbi:MAG TPA: hypothetical protein VNN08_09840 [Thermoanaerobaculia bacterium]|nr:hypothetical protein [Thermoanaerobaculia bacterium]